MLPLLVLHSTTLDIYLSGFLPSCRLVFVVITITTLLVILVCGFQQRIAQSCLVGVNAVSGLGPWMDNLDGINLGDSLPVKPTEVL